MHLPDEIVNRVLSPLLLVPDDQFFSVSWVSPFSTPSEYSSSSALVVSKQWMRVATPLLYSHVILRSPAQAQALSRALTRNKAFGQYIRRLRVEGGYGATMHKILSLAPNIVDIALQLDTWSPDTTTGLVSSLKLLHKVERLCLIGKEETYRRRGRVSKAQTDLLAALATSINQSWNKLHTVYWPYYVSTSSFGRVRDLLHAMDRPGLELTFYIQSEFHSAEELRRLLNVQTIRRIVVMKSQRGFPLRYGSRTRTSQLMEDVQGDAALIGKIEFESAESEIDIWEAQVDGVDDVEPLSGCTPFEGASDDIQDEIWGRILFFALEADHLPSDADLAACKPRRFKQGSQTIKFSQMRLQLAMTCQRFYRLALPYLGVDLELDSLMEVVSFAIFLLRHRQLGPHIRTCTYRLTAPKRVGFDIPTDQWLLHIADLEQALLDLHSQSHDYVAERAREADRRTALINPGPNGIFSRALDSADSWDSDDSSQEDQVATFHPDELKLALMSSQLGLEFIVSASSGLLQLVSADNAKRSLVIIRRPAGTNRSGDIEGRSRPTWRLWQRALPANIKVLDVHFQLARSDYGEEICRDDLLRYQGLVALSVRDGQGSRLDPGHFGYAASASGKYFDAQYVDQAPDDRPSLPRLVSLRCEAQRSYHFSTDSDDSDSEASSNKEDRQRYRAIDAPFLNALRPLHLPSLRHLDLQAPASAYLGSKAHLDGKMAVIAFLEEHGQQLREVKLNFADPEMRLLDKTPLLEELHLRVLPDDVDYAIFAVDQKHHHLKKVMIGCSQTDSWQRFRLDADHPLAKLKLDAFPALEELHVRGCHWPTSERELKKDKEKIAWITLSDRLARDYGVRLKDGAGVHWVPRLASSGNRRKS